jgi:hypothetical protein
MVLTGAAVLAVLLVAGLMLVSTLSNTAAQPVLSGTLSVAQTPSGPELAASYSNLGNRPEGLPPEAVPFLDIQGIPFSIAPAVLSGSVAGSAGKTTVYLPALAVPPSCTPQLVLSPPSTQGYVSVSGVRLLGPATLSVVFEGTAAWPSTGLGLMLATNLSSLFVIGAAGSGNTTATVAYDSYSQSAGAITGQLARSQPFELDTEEPTELVLSLTGFGDYAVSVDGIPRLAGAIHPFLPGYSPLAVWASNASSILGVVTVAGGDTRWVGPSATCGFLFIVPLAAIETPEITSNLTGARIVGPVVQPPLPTGSLYVLEAVLTGPSVPAAVSLADCNPVPLDVNGTFTFTAPWVE